MKKESIRSLNQIKALSEEKSEFRRYMRMYEACRNYQLDRRILQEIAIECGALYKINSITLIDMDIFEEYFAVPFKAGDIVEIDLYPFADKRIIEIVEVGDNHDCCCLQALSRRKDGSWTIGAVNTGI